MAEEGFVAEIIEHGRQHERKLTGDEDVGGLGFHGSSGGKLSDLFLHLKCFSFAIVIDDVACAGIVYARDFSIVEAVVEGQKPINGITDNRVDRISSGVDRIERARRRLYL